MPGFFMLTGDMNKIGRIALVTDFGPGSPYVGQMRLRLAQLAPATESSDLVSDLPPFRSDLAAYLLPALARDVPDDTLFLCIVDPGVGGERAVIALEADGRWYLGPDNGLLSMVARHASRWRLLRVTWRPERLSNSFHGRDLFCPLAAMLVAGEVPESASLELRSLEGFDWPSDLAAVVYRDGYGNLVTGLRASEVNTEARIWAANRDISSARTFCEVPAGKAFWYENSFGLIEIAVNRGRADQVLGLGPGDQVVIR